MPDIVLEFGTQKWIKVVSSFIELAFLDTDNKQTNMLHGDCVKVENSRI